MSTRWYEYVLKISRGMNAKQAAQQAGLHAANLTHWKYGRAPTIPLAIQFARGMNGNVLAALVAAEVITVEEASRGLWE